MHKSYQWMSLLSCLYHTSMHWHYIHTLQWVKEGIQKIEDLPADVIIVLCNFAEYYKFVLQDEI